MKVERKIWNSVRILYFRDSLEAEKNYEKVTNLVLEYGGRIHGSQFVKNDTYGREIAVYFELPKENVEEFLKEEKRQ